MSITRIRRKKNASDFFIRFSFLTAGSSARHGGISIYPQSTYLQFIVDFLHFGSLGEIFVQIEKVLELKLGQRQRVALPRGQSGNVEGLLHAPSLGLVGGERFDYAIIGQRTERKQTRAPGPRKCGRDREKITNKLVTHN